MPQRDLHELTMAELIDKAQRAGIDNVEHMSKEELIEAITQEQPERTREKKRTSESSLPPGWENFPGNSP